MDSDCFREFNYGGVYIVNNGGRIEAISIDEYEKIRNAADVLYRWYENGYIRSDIAMTINEEEELKDGTPWI